MSCLSSSNSLATSLIQFGRGNLVPSKTRPTHYSVRFGLPDHSEELARRSSWLFTTRIADYEAREIQDAGQTIRSRGEMWKGTVKRCLCQEYMPSGRMNVGRSLGL